MGEKKISEAVIRRLPRYYRYLGEMRERGVQRISSGELSDKMKVTASQIRQDLNNFGGFGQQGYGYNVEYLHDEIGKILGIDHTHNMIVVGAGHMCQAIVNSEDYARRGFAIKGVFDNDSALEGLEVGPYKVMMMKDMAKFVRENNVEIATITVPREAAKDVAHTLVEAGIKAIWNFAHVDLNVPDDVLVENVHLSESIMRLSYNMKRKSG